MPYLFKPNFSYTNFKVENKVLRSILIKRNYEKEKRTGIFFSTILANKIVIKKHGMMNYEDLGLLFLVTLIFLYIHDYNSHKLYIHLFAQTLYGTATSESISKFSWVLFFFKFELLDPLTQSPPVVMYLPKAMSQYNSRVYAMRNNRSQNIICLSHFHYNMNTQLVLFNNNPLTFKPKMTSLWNFHHFLNLKECIFVLWSTQKGEHIRFNLIKFWPMKFQKDLVWA